MAVLARTRPGAPLDGRPAPSSWGSFGGRQAIEPVRSCPPLWKGLWTTGRGQYPSESMASCDPLRETQQFEAMREALRARSPGRKSGRFSARGAADDAIAAPEASHQELTRSVLVDGFLNPFGIGADHRGMVPVAAVHMLPIAVALVGGLGLFGLWLVFLIRTDRVDAMVMVASVAVARPEAAAAPGPPVASRRNTGGEERPRVVVRPGSFCAALGTYATTTGGTPMVCSAAGHARPRWRRAHEYQPA